MKQRLNKAKKYKEQERLAKLAIASAWAYGCTLRQAQTKCLSWQVLESSIMFTATKEGGSYCNKGAESALQDKHF